MKNKTIVIILIVSLFATSLIGGCSSGQNVNNDNVENLTTEEPIILRMSYSLPSNSPCDLAAKKFGELLKERTDGKITLETHPNCGLSGGNLIKAYEMLQVGDIDIHGSSPITISNFDKRFFVFWLPWMFPTHESLIDTINSPLMNDVDQWAQDKNQNLLAIGDGGARQISNSVREIRKPEDLKHLKIRVPSVQMFIDLYKEFGANPIAMDFSEVYTSLQQGTIDGQENPISTISASKLDEVQKYITIWDYVRDQLLWTINKDRFSSFDDDTKEIIKQCAKEAMNYNNEAIIEMEKEQIIDMEGNGVKITYLTPEEIKLFSDIALPIYSSYETEIGKSVIDKFIQQANK